MSDHLRPHDAALARLQGLHPKAIDLSLGRVLRLCAFLGHPERRLPPVIHVTGTNGKGSTVAFIRAIAEAAGLSAHVYTSPHLVRFAEREQRFVADGGEQRGEFAEFYFVRREREVAMLRRTSFRRPRSRSLRPSTMTTGSSWATISRESPVKRRGF